MYPSEKITAHSILEPGWPIAHKVHLRQPDRVYGRYMLTQVQGVIAEYERAKIAERYRRGELFRSRAGEVLAWRTPYGYHRQARDTTGPARLVVFDPEAAIVWRIFDDYTRAGYSTRQIARRLHADDVPPPAGRRAVWSTSTISRILHNEAYVGRVYFNRTESIPDHRPGRRSKQVPRPREEWIPISVPSIVDEATFEAVNQLTRDNSKMEPATCRAWPMDAAWPGQVRLVPGRRELS